MKAKVILEVSHIDYINYQIQFEKENGREMTGREMRDMLIDQFISNKNDYIDPDYIQIVRFYTHAKNNRNNRTTYTIQFDFVECGHSDTRRKDIGHSSEKFPSQQWGHARKQMV
jgi:hypothetical protein